MLNLLVKSSITLGMTQSVRAWLLAFIFMVIGPLSSVGFAKEGGISSNGGGDLRSPELGSAILQGYEPITYCIEMAPDFGATSAEAEAAVARSFKKWKAYVGKKRVTLGMDGDHFLTETRLDDPTRFSGIPLTMRFYGIIGLILNTQARSTCQGDERVKFSFGIDSPEITRVRPANLSHPLAFSVTTEMDWSSRKHRGLVWVAKQGASKIKENPRSPDWSIPGMLDVIITHEIGHLLGNPHVPGTIMREDVAVILSEIEATSLKAPGVPYFLTADIDQQRELYTPGRIFPRTYVNNDLPAFSVIKQKAKTTFENMYDDLERRGIGKSAFENASPKERYERGFLPVDPVTDDVKLGLARHRLARIMGVDFRKDHIKRVTFTDYGYRFFHYSGPQLWPQKQMFPMHLELETESGAKRKLEIEFKSLHSRSEDALERFHVAAADSVGNLYLDYLRVPTEVENVILHVKGADGKESEIPALLNWNIGPTPVSIRLNRWLPDQERLEDDWIFVGTPE